MAICPDCGMEHTDLDPETQARYKEDFSLTPDQIEELEGMISAFHKRCAELEVPMILQVVYAKETQEQGFRMQGGKALHLPGERTPSHMAVAALMIKENISVPLELVSIFKEDMQETGHA